MKQRIYIQGQGIVCAIGNDNTAIVNACKNTPTPPNYVSLPHSVDKPVPYYFAKNVAKKVVKNVAKNAAQKVENNMANIADSDFSINDDAQSHSDNLYRYIKSAVSDAIVDANLNTQEIRKLGIFLGTSSNEIGVLESRYQFDLQTATDPYPLRINGFGELMAFIAQQFDIQGPQYNFVTACSSSANALTYAAQMIDAGKIEHALVVGTESFNYMSIFGFHAMMLLSDKQCLPFDARRDGIVLGEGVGALVLGARPRDNRSFYIKSGANLCDTGGVTSSSPEAIAKVMQTALTRASLYIDDIPVIKAHGTSTVSNDTAEGQAMSMLFNDKVPPFTSLKPYLGHTMGACGAVELICLLACLGDGFIPKTPGFSQQDETLQISPLTQALPFTRGNIMLNFFGFGGNNSTFILSNLE